MHQQIIRQYLIKILGALEDNRSAVLVGGQCLLFWATVFENKGHKNLQVATRDIDFIGDKSVVTKLEKLLAVKPSVPGFDDATPELGVFRVPIDGQELVVDVLANIAGLSKHEIEKYTTTFNFEGRKIQLLSPIGMLKSRVANVTLLRRTDEHSIAQLKSSIRIVNHFLIEILNIGYGSARKEIALIMKFADSRDGINLFNNHGIDILDAIPREHFNYPEEFISRHLTANISKIAKKRKPKP